MRLIFLLLFTLLHCGLMVRGQQPLINQTYEDYRSNIGLSIVVGPEGYTIIGEGYSLQLGGNAGIKTLRIDEFGYLLWQTTYGKQTFDYLAGYVGGTFKTLSGQALISFGSFCDANQTCKGLILKQTINGDTIWTKRFGSINKSILQKGLELPNGDLIGVGFSSVSGINGQIWLVKTDSSGSLLWQKYYGGSGFEEARGIVQTPDKGFILAGTTSSKGEGSQDAYIVKVDSFGNFEWDKTYGNFFTDYHAGITSTSDGGYYLFWNAEDNELGPGLHPTYEKRSYLTKTDALGNVLWQKILLQDNFEWAYVNQLKELNYGKEIILVGSKKVQLHLI